MATERIAGVSDEAMQALGEIGFGGTNVEGSSESTEKVDGSDVTTDESTEVAEDETPTEDALDVLDRWSKEGDSAEETTPTPESKKAPASKVAPSSTNFEMIKAGGREIKVDYSDRESIKKAFKEAAGMRMFQKERDDTRRSLEAIQKEHQEIKSLWDRLEKAYSEAGPEGVLKEITGGKAGLDALLDQREQQRKFRASASPEQLRALELEENLVKERRERETALQRQKEIEDRLNSYEEKSAIQALESVIHPAFNQFSFEGKLGDPDREDLFNEMLWTKSKALIAKLPDASITSANVKAIFRKVATTLDSTVKAQAETVAKKVSESRKAAAKETVQADVRAGLSTGSNEKEFAKKIRSGNVTGALEDFLSGKIKL